MKQIDLASIDRWMHRNAREIDLKLWNCLFQNGQAVEVADALLAYQNEDGGFGHGLDPDNWNANSTPYDCLYALQMLQNAGFRDISHPVFQGIRKYLNDTTPSQWLFTLPSNEDYPHAIFFNYGEKYNEKESTGVIISLSAFVLEYVRDLPVYDMVMKKLDSFIRKIKENDLGDMGPSSYILLLETMKRVGIEGYDYDELQKRLIDVVNQVMQKEEEQWQNYGYRPSDFIKSKESIFYPGNEAVVEKECDYLIRTLPKEDVWPVSWCWFDNGKLYPAEEAISLNWAKALKGMERLQFLKAFGRI